MKKTEFDSIERGAIMQNKGSGESYVVESTERKRIGDDPGNWIIIHLGIRTVTMTNPDEWKLIKK